MKIFQLKPRDFSFVKEKDGYNMYQSECGMVLLVPVAITEDQVFRSQETVKLSRTLPLNERIRKARENLGFTQRDLALASGITQGEISAIEKGSSKPGISVIRKLLPALHVDFQFFE